MDYAVLEKSTLFHDVPAGELRAVLASAPHRVQRYEKGEIIFHLMERASSVGVILEGRVEAQKSFPNGSQVNVSVRGPGETIGPAAAFSSSQKYPCDLVALEPVRVMLFRKEDLLSLMRGNVRILANFTTEIASATYMLQQRLELLSYSGIAQKAAFWLLTRMRQTGKSVVSIPESMSKWAMLMNVSRPSLHRELKRLEERGMISRSALAITIRDEEALRDVLSQW